MKANLPYLRLPNFRIICSNCADIVEVPVPASSQKSKTNECESDKLIENEKEINSVETSTPPNGNFNLPFFKIIYYGNMVISH